eukprot:TRINITY_DN8768_c0_g7_i2.p1 TRINITY_DN8768_c0_g7~~TRINITY_DN8768_c0_g7_i2.p1  ORF type:complete len:505 (+),score=167.71 TRINITY_DN8768_c0_g7_i2:73-1587(+)
MCIRDRYTRDAEKARKELKDTKNQLVAATDDLDSVRAELAHQRRKYEDASVDFNRRIGECIARGNELESDLLKANAQIAKLKEKGLRYEEVSEQLKETAAREKAMQVEMVAQAGVCDSRTEEVKKLNTSIVRLKQEVNLLTNDKEYLQKENVVLSEKNKRLEDKNDQLMKDLQDSKAKINEYVDKLLNTKDDVRTKYEAKYLEQLNDLKESHRKDIESAKSTLTEIYEKRIQSLTQEKIDTDTKLATTEQSLKNKTDQYEDLLQENHTLQKKLNEDCSSLRVELRFKDEETMKLTNQYEEQLHNYKEAQIEALALKEKLDVLRAEYYKLESSSRQGQADIRAENAMLKERLKNYEQIEQELDQAIVQASEGGVGSELGNALASAIAHAPTTAKRRIQQSLILSNKLLEKQKEMDTLNDKLKETRRENEKLNEEVQMYKRLSEKTNQPYSYLTVGIEKAEKELYQAQKENKTKSQVIDNLKKEVEELREVEFSTSARVRGSCSRT